MKRPFVIGIVLFLIVTLSMFFIPPLIIKESVEKFGTELFQTQVKVGAVDLDYANDSLELQNVTLANPDGFRLDDALFITSIRVVLESGSFFDGHLIHFREVDIKGTTINIEYGLKGYNYHELSKKYGKDFQIAVQPTEEGAPTSSIPRTRVIIDDLKVRNTTLVVTQAAPIGKPKQEEIIQFDDLHMQDIGKRFELSFADAITDVLFEGSNHLPDKFRQYKVKGVIENIKEQYEKNN